MKTQFDGGVHGGIHLETVAMFDFGVSRGYPQTWISKMIDISGSLGLGL